MTKPKLKILIVDDDAATRESVSLALKEQDFFDTEVASSPDAASGIQQMKAMKPDVIILDLHLPDKSGFEFMDIMHKDKDLSKIKVVLLTADDTLDNLFKAEGKGISAYQFLGKPFNIADLLAVVLGTSLPSKK